MQVKKQQLEPDMEQWTGSKLAKEYVKAVYCHPAYLTCTEYIMQDARPDEAQARITPGAHVSTLRNKYVLGPNTFSAMMCSLGI